MKKEKGMLKNMKLLNPKNLEKEVHIYGYHFSWKSHLLLIAGALLGISAVGILFKLKPLFLMILMIAVVFMLPVFILNMYRRMYEQKRFSDVATYMEQMLYSFQKSGKVTTALKETLELFEEGQMREKIDQAITYLETGKTETEAGILREALKKIEAVYACEKLNTVHELLISSEEYGGDTENTILLLLSDIEIWKRRGYRLQADKKESHTDNILSVIISVIMCAVALYVMDTMRNLFPGVTGTDIFQIGIIQVTSLGFILLMLFVLVKSFKSMTVNWLQNGVYEEKVILNSYETVINYDAAKEKRKSLIYAAPFLIAAVPVFFLIREWLAIPCVLIGVFMLFQHRIGFSLCKKEVNNQLYITLPQWLMELTLLLQNNNVQVSIIKSASGASPVLRKELEKLIERMQCAPGQLKTYTDFCKTFDVPEIQSCMKMLHAISESGTGNAKVQINNLVQRVNEMQDMADNIRNENISFKMKMVFHYPVLASTVKLLIDFTIGMVYMFQMLGNIGGGA